jgi:hypothetical protein
MTKPEKAGLQDLYFFGSEQEVSEDYVMRNSKHSWTSHFPWRGLCAAQVT